MIETAIMRIYARILAVVFKLRGQNVTIAPKVSIHPFTSIQPGPGKITIGRGTVIYRGAMLLAFKGTITLGENVSVHPYTMLYGHGGLNIGNDVRIATHVVVIPADHIYEGRDKPIFQKGEKRLGITIEDDVWIGAGAKILDGSHIAKGCVIGAGAVVKTKTDPYGVYVGTPAKLVKSR